MAEVTTTIHVRVLTFDPAQNEMIPVPNARLLVEDDGWLYDPDLSDGNQTTAADGRAQVPITYDDENPLNPFFTIELPEGDRLLPAGAPAQRQITLPGKWVTRHYASEALRDIASHDSADTELNIFVGLDATLRLAYTDFHRSGVRDPLALPQDTIRVHLSDHDYFLFDWWIFDWLNPDDTMTGYGAQPDNGQVRPGRTAEVGEGAYYPYFDVWPSGASALALDSPPAGPRAWLEPPGAPAGTLGGSSFENVGPLAVGPHAFVFMIDGNVVRRFYPDGTLCETISEWRDGGGLAQPFDQPGGLVVDSGRNLYVADTGNRQIVTFYLDDSAGPLAPTAGRYHFASRLNDWTDHAEDPLIGTLENFDQPQGLALVAQPNDRTRVYLAVADAGKKRVILFDAGHVVTHTGDFGDIESKVTFGTNPDDSDHFVEPIAVAADGDGRLYVVDRGSHQVSRWALNDDATAATFQADWGVAGGGSGDGDFQTPEAIAVDAKSDYVYVAEAGNQRVQRLNAETGGHQVHWQYSYTPALGESFTPLAVTVDPRGDVYAADSANGRVVRGTVYDATLYGDNAQNLPPGTAPQPFGQPWTPRTAVEHMVGPTYVHFDTTGKLWVSDAGNQRVLVFERNAAGELAHSATLSGDPLHTPVGVVVDADGSVFVVDAHNHCVHHYDADLNHQGQLGSHGSDDGNLDQPHGIALARREAGTLLVVADTGNDRVQFLQRDGTFVAKIDTDIAVPAGNPSALSAPQDVAVDGSGRLYIADTGNSRVLRFSASDAFERNMTVTEHHLSLSAPRGVSVDDANNLLISDSDKNTVFHVQTTAQAGREDGSLLGFWNLHSLLRQTVMSGRWASFDGTVHLSGDIRPQPTTPYKDQTAWSAQGSGQLRIRGSGSDTEDVTIAEGSILLVQDGATVERGDLLALVPEPWAFYPELAHLLVFDAPGRAVVDGSGLLAVADTGNDRVRLARTYTDLKVNLFDIGQGAFESLPDVSFRAATKADWSTELGLKMQAGDSGWIFDDPYELVTDPDDEHENDYSRDHYLRRHTFRAENRLNGAINAMRVARLVQQWLAHLTRTDEAEHRWHGPQAKSLFADLEEEEGSSHSWFSDVIKLGTDVSGRGLDAWDDSTVAHEMGHWIFDQSLPRWQVSEFRTRYDIDEHMVDQIINPTVTIVEGFAEYVQLFLGSEFANIDRIRGFAERELANLNTSESQRRDLYHSPGLGLENEGYFANTLWQIHHLLAEPGIRFADSPTYWHPYNAFLEEAQSQCLVSVLRRPFRNFSRDLSSEEQDRGSFQILKQILAQVRAEHGDLAEAVQTILEINNQLMPSISITEGTSDAAPGTPLAAEIQVAEGETKNLIFQVTDATGSELAGYNLRFRLAEAEHPGQLSLPAGDGPPLRHGTGEDDLSFARSGDLFRATNEHGIVNLAYSPAAGSSGGTDVLEVAYQPKFATDAVFAPPQAGDDLRTTLRKLYLLELQRVAPPGSYGATVTGTLTIHIP